MAKGDHMRCSSLDFRDK